MTKKEEITQIFDSFNKLTALVIGDVMIDSYLWGKVDRISPEAPVPIVAVKKRENRLGGAANVALNIQALGAKPILCSVIGNEDKGDLFIDLLTKQHLSTKGILRSKNRITTTKFRVLGNNTQMLRVDEEIETDLRKEETEALFNSINDLLHKEKIDVIIFEDYDKGIITPDFIHKIVSLANELTIPVAVDPKRKNFSAYRHISLFKPNLKEIKEGLKIDFNSKNIDELTNAVKLIQEKQNIDIVLATLSEDGIFVSYKESCNTNTKLTETIPAHIRNIADVSGAGDTVISVASLCLALKLLPHRIALIANIAGGLVCEKVGVVPINKQELIEETLSLFT